MIHSFARDFEKYVPDGYIYDAMPECTKEHFDDPVAYFLKSNPRRALYDVFDYIDNPVCGDADFQGALTVACGIAVSYHVEDWIVLLPWAHEIIEQLWSWGRTPRQVAAYNYPRRNN